MPLLRCTECEYEAIEMSRLAIGGECPHCEGELVEATDDDEVTPDAFARAASDVGPQLSLAREAARKLLSDLGIVGPPVPVEEIATKAGFRIVVRQSLGQLSGRLVGNAIELAPASRSRHRFVVAHELGHHFMGKSHGSGRHVEKEVNAFAGELLVPGPFLSRALEQTVDGAALARRFEVSRQVLDIAAQNHHVQGRIRGPD